MLRDFITFQNSNKHLELMTIILALFQTKKMLGFIELQSLWLTLGEHQYQAEIIIHLMSYFLIIILG